MKSSYILLTLSSLLGLTILSCSANQSAQNWIHKTERNWAKLEKQEPEWAEMLDSSALATRLNFLQEVQQQAMEWEKKPVDPVIKQKIEALATRLKEDQIRLELQQNDPRLYNLGLRLQKLPMTQLANLQTLAPYLDQASKYYQQAKQKLYAVEPALCDSAIQQHIQGITFVQSSLAAAVATDEKEKARLDHKISRACFYMKDYLAWCRSKAFEARN